MIAAMTKHRLCDTVALAPGSGGEFPAGDRLVALFRLAEPRGYGEGGGEWFALDGLCPHAGGPLGRGCLEGTAVTCPWHGWRFDVTTGVHALTPAIVHETLPVSVEDGGVWVELPD